MKTHLRYHSLAIIMHWVMALAIIVMLVSGMTMAYIPLDKNFISALFPWHKALGVLLLWAAVLRVAIRLMTPPPALPDFGLRVNRLIRWGHGGLYALMLGMPLSGWLLVSSGTRHPYTGVFGWFTWPPIPGVLGNEMWHELAEETHGWLALILLVMLVGHIGAVVWHAKVNKHNLLPRLWWR